MSTNIKVKKWIFVIIPLIIVAISGVVILIGMLRPEPPRQMLIQSVVLHEIKKASAISSLKALGLVEANKRVELLARVSGFLVEKSFQEGDRVKQCQVLFQIEPDQYQAAFSDAQAREASAQAQLNLATVDYNRTNDLYQKRSSPKSDLDNALSALDVARASLQSAQAQLEQARLNLEYTSIKAPFDGLVSDSPFSEGTLISPGSGVLATVVAIDPVEVSFGISDAVMAKMRFGNDRSGLPGGKIDNAQFSLSIIGENQYDQEGEVIYISPEVDRNTDTVKVKVRFPNPQGILAPGQSVVVNITPKAAPQVLLLPKTALMTSEGRRFVYLTAPAPDPPSQSGQPGPTGQAGGAAGTSLVAELRNVTVGDEFHDGFEVISGLKEGDKVVILGLMSAGARLRPGAPVVVVEPPAEQNTNEPQLPDAKDGSEDQAGGE
jgi:membrane fusion protein (multidrug efflux system)